MRTVTAPRRPAPRRLAALPLLAAAFASGPAAAQLGREFVPSENAVGVRLPSVDRANRRLFDLAVRHLDGGRPDEAVVYFQKLLDDAPDGFLESVDGAELLSLRTAVVRRLEDLIDDSDAYRLRYGPAAQGALDDALATGDAETLAAVARRFPVADAGREAAYRLAVRQADRGEPLAAAAALDRLRDRLDADRRRVALVRLAGCRLRLGDAAALDEALEDLADAGGEVVWAGVPVAATALEPEPLGRPDPPVAPPAGPGVRWTVASLADPFKPPGDEATPLDARLSEWFHETAATSLLPGRSGAPTTVPIAAGGLILYRTPCQLVAADAATGAVRWRSLPDPLCWDYLAGPTGGLAASAFRNVLGQRLWSDATWGTVTTDARIVFAVEEAGCDGPLPAPDSSPAAVLPSDFNRLVAYDLATGRRVFEAGGPPDEPVPLAGLFFLGPPTPVAGRWYALAEASGGVTELVGLDPDRPEPVLWRLPVAEQSAALDRNPTRRTAGLTPAAVAGLLVCPVGPGTVVAVDPATRGLLWAARVGGEAATNEPPPPLPGGLRRPGPWVNVVNLPPPQVTVVAGGLLLTAASSDPFGVGSVALLNPRDGAVRWRREVKGSLWPLGSDADALYLLTRNGAVALALSDGAPLWDAALGRPSGRGLLRAGRLVVPLADERLVVLAAADGAPLATFPTPDSDQPGNLLTVAGSLVWQGATRLVSIPLPETLGEKD